MEEAEIKDIYDELGQRVRNARTRAGVTQGQLAQRIGLTRSSVANLEAGRQKIMLHVLLGIAEALDVGPEDLLPNRRQDKTIDLARLNAEARNLQADDRDFVLSAVRTGVGRRSQ
ncbi:helix-turn-helix transcriptional regulator [Micromonospora sp. B11E3]|jgi:transcriptional regulator with XRE-family HTH domain|uniref:helix-turn-helix domain-containing protein n=1 Tax=Micromonospora sp. B11E3 TaxID=3153562 RepID=UPI00325C5A6A